MFAEAVRHIEATDERALRSRIAPGAGRPAETPAGDRSECRAALSSGHRRRRAAGSQTCSSCAHQRASPGSGATRASPWKPVICSARSTTGSPKVRCTGSEGCESTPGRVGMKVAAGGAASVRDLREPEARLRCREEYRRGDRECSLIRPLSIHNDVLDYTGQFEYDGVDRVSLLTSLSSEPAHKPPNGRSGRRGGRRSHGSAGTLLRSPVTGTAWAVERQRTPNM